MAWEGLATCSSREQLLKITFCW